MRGTSAASLTTVRAGFEPVLAAAGAKASVLGAQLFAVVDALDGSASLRRALSDPSRDGAAKAALVTQLLGGQADERVVAVLGEIARARWSSDTDLVDAVDELAVNAVLASAQATGDLPRVEDELFRVDRLLVGQRELRAALVDRDATPAARSTLAHRLLDATAHAATAQLVARGATAPRGRTMAALLGYWGEQTARRRELLVATVTAAAPLSPAQEERLAAALTRTYGREVHLAVAVDPTVIGGLRVRIGSQVVDATVLGRVDDVRRRLAG